MFAIVEIAGQQFKVEKDQRVFVHRLDTEEGKSVDFNNVLLVEDGGKTTVGAPAISGAFVSAKVERHLKGDKVIVFKKKRRKGYQKKNGHRQYLTELTISKIALTGGKAAAPKKEAKPAAKKEEAPMKAAAPAPKAKATDAKADDLKKIEGIGPKCAEHLNAGGIHTFNDLASAKLETLKDILEKAGPRYNIIDPTRWAEQATLAAAGKWDELKVLQDELDGGKRN
ncbi:MAG: 50S ribosomal protein L21 [Flavobacteriales bacterium]